MTTDFSSRQRPVPAAAPVAKHLHRLTWTRSSRMCGTLTTRPLSRFDLLPSALQNRVRDRSYVSNAVNPAGLFFLRGRAHTVFTAARSLRAHRGHQRVQADPQGPLDRPVLHQPQCLRTFAHAPQRAVPGAAPPYPAQPNPPSPCPPGPRPAPVRPAHAPAHLRSGRFSARAGCWSRCVVSGPHRM